MAITYCVLAFANRLHKTNFTAEAFKKLLETIPEDCPRVGCTPGGCRFHCREFATGEWVKSRNKRIAA